MNDEPNRAKKGRTAAHLTSDEQALWDHTARSIERLAAAKAKNRVLDGAEGAGDFFEAMESAGGVKRRAKADRGTDGPSPAGGLPGLPMPPPTPDRRTPALANFDRKAAKRLRAGRIVIEARMDLHGMRQDEAHGALSGFLRSCQARGMRWVLVITGKGAPRRSTWNSDGDDFRFEMGSFDTGGRPEPGILRRSVPRWLAEPDLRALVVSHTEAAANHGGEGALYVQLRRRD
jgi:DNA-nicking Smr family endonuclease